MKIAYKPQSTVGDAGMKTTMSARANLLTKRGALLAPVMMSFLLIGAPSQAQAKSLASAVIDIQSLLWMWDRNNTPGNRDDDVVLRAIIGGSSGDNISLVQEDDNVRLRIERPGQAAVNRTGTADRTSDATDVDVDRLCLGADCGLTTGAPYSNNDFTTAPEGVASSNAEYAYADQLMQQSAFGIEIVDGGGAGRIGLRAESRQANSGTATPGSFDFTVRSELQRPGNQTSATVEPPASAMRTYFEMDYGYFAVAELSSADEGEARAQLDFLISITPLGFQWAPLTGTPGQSALEIAANETNRQPTPLVQAVTKLYSPDIVLPAFTEQSLVFNLAALASTRSDDSPVSVPATLPLMLAGVLVLSRRKLRFGRAC